MDARLARGRDPRYTVISTGNSTEPTRHDTDNPHPRCQPGVVAWVGATGRHHYPKGTDIAFTGDAIDFVGAVQPILEDFGFLTLGLGPLLAICGPNGRAYWMTAFGR